MPFFVAALKFRGFLGERGLLPTPRLVEVVPFRSAPSLFHCRHSDGLFAGVTWTGVVLSAATVAASRG